MAEIEEINLNRFELKLADTDDPVAQQLDWNPLHRGGANFKTHELEVTPSSITVRRTAGMWMMLCLCAGIGVLAYLFSFREVIKGEALFLPLFLFVLGSIWLLVAGIMAVSGKPLRFDRQSRLYYRGTAFRHEAAQDRNSQGRLSDIHAIQLVGERIQSSSRSGVSSYNSYEVNLVFKDGFRVNVMDHGNLNSIEQSAKTLGTFLNVPVWRASY